MSHLIGFTYGVLIKTCNAYIHYTIPYYYIFTWLKGHKFIFTCVVISNYSSTQT